MFSSHFPKIKIKIMNKNKNIFRELKVRYSEAKRWVKNRIKMERVCVLYMHGCMNVLFVVCLHHTMYHTTPCCAMLCCKICFYIVLMMKKEITRNFLIPVLYTVNSISFSSSIYYISYLIWQNSKFAFISFYTLSLSIYKIK